ncbi:MAG: hypothetical protein ACPGSD_11495 [Flavobacteriales bacterium]
MVNKSNELILEQTTSLEQFSDMCNEVQANLLACDNLHDLNQLVKVDVVNFSQLIIALGDLEQKKNDSNAEMYWFNYLIPKAFKTLFVFSSELFFESSKALLYLSEKEINKDKCEDLFSKSYVLLLKSFEEFEVLKHPSQYTDQQNIKVEDVLRHEENPWDIFRNQIQTIQNQIQLLYTSFSKAEDFSRLFLSLKQIIESHGGEVMNSCNDLKGITNALADDLENRTDVKQIIQTIEKHLENDSLIDKTHQNFTQNLDVEMNKFEKIEIPENFENGELVLTTYDLEQSVRKWLDYEVLSNFIDLWALKDNLRNYFRLSLTHVKNNLKIKLESDDFSDFENLYDSLNKLFEQIKFHQNKEEDIVNQINQSVSSQLKMVQYFKQSNPLEVPLKNSLNLKGSDVLKKIKGWVSKWTKPLLETNHIQHDSEIETATQSIAYRMMKVENEQYDSLFLNKNFIGDLFLIKRPVLEEKIANTINLWNQGFNQSALIIGNRLSGKSTFMDYVSKQHFGKRLLRIEPHSEIIVSGRKIKISCTLEDVLSELKKHARQNDSGAIVIDDLEQWNFDSCTVLENARALIRFVESESDHTFVMVSCSPFMKDILDKRIGFSRSFSTIVDVTKSNESEIVQAIQMRHGASHKHLYNEKMEQLTTSQMHKIIRKQIRRNDYNLGEILQAWTYTTVVKDYNKVVISGNYSDFPNFFTAEELLVLKQIYLYRVSNEYRLKTTMGFEKDSELRSAIKRLLNTKVLERGAHGFLSINPIVLQDVQNILLKQNTLVQ